MKEDCLVVLDPRTTVLEMLVSRCLREKTIEQSRPVADGGNGSEPVNSHLISRRRRSAESAVLRFWATRGEKLPRELVSEMLLGISRVLSSSFCYWLCSC